MRTQKRLNEITKVLESMRRMFERCGPGTHDRQIGCVDEAIEIVAHSECVRKECCIIVPDEEGTYEVVITRKK